MENINLDAIDVLGELDSIHTTTNYAIPKIVQKYTTIEFIYKTSKKSIPVKSKNKYIEFCIFFSKYVFTSSLIFALLMVTTNYSAYMNVIKSIVYQTELAETSQSIINSVEASHITEKFKDQAEKELSEKGTLAIDDQQRSIKQILTASKKDDIQLDIEITPYSNRIVIPKIGKNIPLLDIVNKEISGENELNDIFMTELENGVVRYPGSAKPGKVGNTFIFGHSSNFPWVEGAFNDVFSLLDKVKYDDEIIVYYGQQKYKYHVTEKKVISPGDVSILERDKGKSEITLMTCWPIGTTLNRLIVTGELVEIK